MPHGFLLVTCFFKLLTVSFERLEDLTMKSRRGLERHHTTFCPCFKRKKKRLACMLLQRIQELGITFCNKQFFLQLAFVFESIKSLDFIGATPIMESTFDGKGFTGNSLLRGLIVHRLWLYCAAASFLKKQQQHVIYNIWPCKFMSYSIPVSS